jgi:hypothetical protein
MTIHAALDSLAKLLRSGRLPITYDPGIERAEPGTLLLGLTCTGAGTLSLNQKGSEYRSVSDLIRHADEQTLAQWTRELGPLTDAHIVVEDLSPDTCLAFILLYLRWEGHALGDTIHTYVNYANLWELGDVTTTGEPFASWGCLHSALAHTYAPASPEFGSGFAACCLFVIHLLRQTIDPREIPRLHTAEYARARSFLQREQQAFLQLLRHAHLLQLQVPIAHSDQTLLVDACLLEEETPHGAVKAFLRNDREHTYFQSGFSLMGVYRPNQAGTGNDIVISVDPASGIYLKELWLKLEELETAKWAGKRPGDRPRFPDRSPYNQPWFDDQGSFTLLGAPKQAGDVPGTLLTWPEVLEAAWLLYNPVQNLRVKPVMPGGSLGAGVPVHQCPSRYGESGKKLLAMKWDASGGQTLLLTPTVLRFLAACIVRQGDSRFPAIGELPSLKSFSMLELPGGFALVHPKGVLIMDDWNGEEMNVPVLEQEFVYAKQRAEKIDETRGKLTGVANRIQQSIGASGKIKGRTMLAFSNELAQIKMDMRTTMLNTMSAVHDQSTDLFRQQVEETWGIQAKIGGAVRYRFGD